MTQLHHFVIVGGGAGGLELATRLGKKLGRKNLAKITLVDTNSTHLWKPLLHEVAAGTLDASQDELNYFVHASAHYFHFQLGRMIGLDRQAKEIILAPIENDTELAIPERRLAYDTLILAFGSITNDFSIPGVAEHCVFLDNRKEADHFQQLFLKHLLRLQTLAPDAPQEKIRIAIVGGGATGVELAAELHYTALEVATYGLDRIDPTKNIHITLIEAADRILPFLSERISKLASEALKKDGVDILTNEKVVEVSAHEIKTASNQTIPTTITVWAVGVKAIQFADQLDGLALNARNQILVKDTLQTTVDDNIFAFGDCAACPQVNTDQFVPPRAQAATQEASLLAKSLSRLLKHQPLLPFHYHDYGSLISLSQSHTLGSLMGKWLGSLLLEGKIARMMYLSLYKKHQTILHGYIWVFLQTLSNFLTRRGKPRLKLH